MTSKVLRLTLVSYVLVHWLLISVTVDADSDDDISVRKVTLRKSLMEDLWNITARLNVLDQKLWDKETNEILIVYDDSVDQLCNEKMNIKANTDSVKSSGLSTTSVAVISIGCFIVGYIVAIVVKHLRKKYASNTSNT